MAKTFRLNGRQFWQDASTLLFDSEARRINHQSVDYIESTRTLSTNAMNRL
jgi:hypothetical protein